MLSVLSNHSVVELHSPTDKQEKVSVKHAIFVVIFVLFILNETESI